MIRSRQLIGAALLLPAAFGGSARAQPADHLLICEAVLQPTASEFIEIVNPTQDAIDLTNYYIADYSPYWRVPTGGVLPTVSDFAVRFPAGATIPAGGVVTVAIDTAGFIAAYGVAPSFKLPPDNDPNVPSMLFAFAGSIGFGRSLTDAGEAVILFSWDQISDLVVDVDIIRLGVPPAGNDFPNKTGLGQDGPDPDSSFSFHVTDTMLMPVMNAGAGPGFSHKRQYLEADTEINFGGNGITGHDETSENIDVTWDGNGIVLFSMPTPNLCDNLTNPPGICDADIAPLGGDGQVNVDDLLVVINQWGLCANCSGDIVPPGGNSAVNVDDLLAVINAWGPCR